MKPTESQTPIGVVLLNLGGPEKIGDVEPFLYNLFSDRKIIRLSPFPFLQKFIARRIAKKRGPKSRESYKKIGGGSPLQRITAEQGRALEETLADRGRFAVTMAMRYWHPHATETLAELYRQGIRKIIALTLYPHYSIATTGSSLDDLRSVALKFSPSFALAEITSWPDNSHYVAALAQTIREGMQKFESGEVQLVYSAHSLPLKFIEEGDPYVEHLQRTIAAVEKEVSMVGRLCYQSRSGPVRWLSPSTPEMLENLASAGCKNVLLVPISFVSDHVETLYEIDMLYRDMASGLGMRLERTASLNTNPLFIAALHELVLETCRKEGWL